MQNLIRRPPTSVPSLEDPQLVRLSAFARVPNVAHRVADVKTKLPAADAIRKIIREARGHAVILDADAAALYGVPTKALLQAVKRNPARFPCRLHAPATNVRVRLQEDLQAMFGVVLDRSFQLREHLDVHVSVVTDAEIFKIMAWDC